MIMKFNTKPLPCIIMLAAGFITCLVAVIQDWALLRFSYTLLIVMFVFYFIGGLIRVILDKALEYFDEPISPDDHEDYFEKLEREEAMKRILKEQD